LFARKNNAKKNALASTHLICSEPGSEKYKAAVKWKLPAVSHKWLLACAKEGKHVSEEPYCVGENSSKDATFCLSHFIKFFLYLYSEYMQDNQL
jgi:hypothetical protein